MRGEEVPTRRTPQQQPPKDREDGWQTKPDDLIRAAVLRFFWNFVRKLETHARECDQAGFYKQLKTMNLKGKRDCSSAYVNDGDGVLLRDVKLIRERWVRWFHTLLNAKSPKLDPNIVLGLNQWPENAALGSVHDAGGDRRHPHVGERKGCLIGKSLR